MNDSHEFDSNIAFNLFHSNNFELSSISLPNSFVMTWNFIFRD